MLSIGYFRRNIRLLWMNVREIGRGSGWWKTTRESISVMRVSKTRNSFQVIYIVVRMFAAGQSPQRIYTFLLSYEKTNLKSPVLAPCFVEWHPHHDRRMALESVHHRRELKLRNKSYMTWDANEEKHFKRRFLRGYRKCKKKEEDTMPINSLLSPLVNITTFSQLIQVHAIIIILSTPPPITLP